MNKVIDVSFGGGGRVHIIALQTCTDEKLELLLKDTDIICMKKCDKYINNV